jgi:hypothetical protein
MIEPVNAIPQRPAAVALRPDARLLEAVQTERRSSVLFSSLPRPNGSLELAPRVKMQLPETLATGKRPSAFLSSVTSFGQDSTISRASFSGGPLATMRMAQEIMRIVAQAPPSAANSRIASEAYLMEIQAQQDYQNHLTAGLTRMREWFA